MRCHGGTYPPERRERPPIFRNLPPTVRTREIAGVALHAFARAYSPEAAWATLLAAFLIAEAFVFGASTKTCGGLDWGVYGLLISPALLHFIPVRVGAAAVTGVALTVGGVLPRVISLHARTVILMCLATTIAAATVGYAIALVQETPCQPL
jgi:hypothetical protein